MPIELTAPTGMTMIAAAHYLVPDAPEDYVPDWSLYFQSDCNPEIFLEFYHVKDVVDAIGDQVPGDPRPSSAWQVLPTPVHFGAGEEFGSYIRGGASVGFDFIVHDLTVTNMFTNQARYEAQNSNLLHIVCPYSYFTSELREDYEALLGAPGTGPIPGTTCGSVQRDVPGTIAGEWFLSSDASAGFGPLSLESGYGNPHPIATNPDQSISLGNVGPSTTGIRIYNGEDTHIVPGEVTEEHCYQIGGSVPIGWLFYRLISDTEMELVYSASGTCPGEFPVGTGRTYYR